MKRYMKILIVTLCILIISIAPISMGINIKNSQNDDTNPHQKDYHEFPLICNINGNGVWVKHQNGVQVDEGTFSFIIRKLGKSGLVYGKWHSTDKTEILRAIIRFTPPIPRADLNPFIGLIKDKELVIKTTDFLLDLDH